MAYDEEGPPRMGMVPNSSARKVQSNYGSDESLGPRSPVTRLGLCAWRTRKCQPVSKVESRRPAACEHCTDWTDGARPYRSGPIARPDDGRSLAVRSSTSVGNHKTVPQMTHEHNITGQIQSIYCQGVGKLPSNTRITGSRMQVGTAQSNAVPLQADAEHTRSGEIAERWYGPALALLTIALVLISAARGFYPEADSHLAISLIVALLLIVGGEGS